MRCILFILLTLSFSSAGAQDFEDYFEDRTLRIDYTFAGDSARQDIYVDELSAIPHWYGKTKRLAEVPLKGNGQVIVRDAQSDSIIYRHSFSTLFQEWLAEDEAKHTRRSFENVFLVPYPKQPVTVTVELYDYHQNINATLTHTVDPQDILIRHIGERNVTPYVTLHSGAAPHPIRIAFVAEGYQGEELTTYLEDCRKAVRSLFSHEPFKSLQDRFNIIALLSTSEESGVSVPRQGIWKRTALGSHFDTFYTERYLTTLHLKRLHDLLAGTPYEHIIILTNTTTYGGGGIYNSYNLAAAHGPMYEPVVVHEFGHSFGGLGDEYPYGDSDPMYFADTEPWEPNLTTQHDFTGKWENLIREGKAGMVEGGGYLSHGVWRGQEDCRMRTNEYPTFCPVCQQALTRLIKFYTE
jgi:hypothetical protein